MKKAKRTAFVLITVLSLFFISIPVQALSVEPSVISGEFLYFSSTAGKILSHRYYYCDDYFAHSGKVSDDHLRTLSLDLALTAYGTNEGADNAEKIFRETGFDAGSLTAQQMRETPAADSVGTVIAHKRTVHGEVVAVVIRGVDYALEWENNVRSGRSGDAEGFSGSAHKVLERIKNYEKINGLTGAKIWMTGYSRGGGIADLAGKYINEDLSSFGITADDLYVYTFEAPAGSIAATGYENIHNVLNPDDVITMVYPALWGLSQSGRNEYLDCGAPEATRKKLNYIGNVGIEELNETVPVRVIGREFVDWLASAVSRNQFADNSSYFGDLISVFMYMTPDEAGMLIDHITESLKELTDPISVYYIVRLFAETPGSSSYEKDLKKFGELIGEALDSRDHSNILSDSEYIKFREALVNASQLFVPAIKNDISLNRPLVKLLSFFGNIGIISRQHFTDTILAAAEASDSYHVPEPISGAVITVDETTAEVISVRIGAKTLVPGLDYSVRYMDEYGNTVEPQVSGTYTAVIGGVGCYSGTASKKFTVKFAHHHSWKLIGSDDTVTVCCISPECEEYGTDVEYEVKLSVPDKEYDGKPAVGSVETGSGFPDEITVGSIVYHDRGAHKELTAVGSYYADVRVYVTDEPEISAYAVRDYSITRIAAQYDRLDIIMSGEVPVTAEVYYDGKKLTELSDYILNYIDVNGKPAGTPDSPGSYYAVWYGRGVYTGTVTKPFVIPEPPYNGSLTAAVIIVAAIVCTGVTAVVICAVRHKKKKQL